MTAKVSIVVPVYRSEAYLERCLDTLVNQTLRDIEIIVVNDGSPDDSQSIIDRYAARCPGLIVPVVKENGGLSDARNVGVARATGDYVGFVDSDDWVDLDMYERLHAQAVAADADVVCHPITYVTSDRYTRHSFAKVLEIFGKPVSESPRILAYANSFAVNKIYRRGFWIENEFEFPLGQAFEDSAIIYNVLYAANRVECVNLPFYYYDKSRAESITSTADTRIYDIFTSCDSILDYYRAQRQWPAMKTWVEYVCLKHIFVRFDLLAGGESSRFVGEFVEAAYDYLARRIPDWRKNYYLDPARIGDPASLIRQFIRRHPRLARCYYTLPKLVRTAAWSVIESGLRLRRRLRPARGQPMDDAARQARTGALIGRDGVALITLVQDLLARAGLRSFAGFRTLASLIATGKLDPRDGAIDIGVLTDSPLDPDRVRIALERAGIRCAREYSSNGQVLMAYFVIAHMPINIYFYRNQGATATTWAFYRDPMLPSRTDRTITELTCPRITGLRTIAVGAAAVWVPEDAEPVLVHAYGPQWRQTERSSDYRDAPGAIQLTDLGRAVAYRYSGGISRSGDVETEACYEQFYAHDLAPPEAATQEREELRELQLITLDVLKEVDRICREHGITYYLGEGTLLGAIRHQGFIPWDDDIDILMSRPEYERFLQVAPGAIDAGYRVEHQSLLPTYWSAFIKVRTLAAHGFTQSTITHLTEHTGPYIDIFPLDSVPDRSSPRQSLQKKLFNRYRRSLSFKTGINYPKSFKTKLTWLYSRFVPIPYLYRKIDETYRMLEAPDNQYLVNLASYYGVERQTLPAYFYGTPRYVRFEDAEFPVPERAEDVLASVYGPRYTSPPNIESRTMAHNWVRDERAAAS